MSQITTKRGKPLMSVQGQLYRFDSKSADGGQFWRCRKDGCSGRIKTDENGVFLEFRNANHSHPMEPENVTVRETVTRMNARAETEATSLIKIYRSGTSALSGQPNTAAAMPTLS